MSERHRSATRRLLVSSTNLDSPKSEIDISRGTFETSIKVSDSSFSSSGRVGRRNWTPPFGVHRGVGGKEGSVTQLTGGGPVEHQMARPLQPLSFKYSSLCSFRYVSVLWHAYHAKASIYI
eukprot:1316795-Amorphochlora_amoeboformis.AAC.1